MSSVIYAIVFKGEVVDGFKPISVKAHMAKLLKADVNKIKTLFSGKQIVIKRTSDKQEAAKYGAALLKIGADVKVRAIKSDASAVAKKAKPAAATSASKPAPGQQAKTSTAGISLAPNEGNLVEPSAPTADIDIDLSHIVLAENDGTPLVEASEAVLVELDLSEYSVSENDGEPLVEPSEVMVAKVEAPDFGLDEPGAVLETLKEEKELLNPNTMGMTIAQAGADLIEADEKDQKPPPKAPDTSAINLVPNFDL